ncbi:MAG: dipeptide epimerase [Peptococcaceae bacterium]|nr:dipeptide epimerase [Peptococcaceae bacterium]
MKITSIEIGKLTIPLIKPFKTALRVLSVSETYVIKVTLENGMVGWGAASPTAVITGDTLGSIRGALTEVLIPQLVGADVENYESILTKINAGVVRNSSARAALDMAVYDLVGKLHNAPLYKFLGGHKNSFETDITVSVNSPKEMADDARKFVVDKFSTLKLKVGIDSTVDIQRVKGIREAVGPSIKIRLDANQGWTAKEAIRVITKMEDMGLAIELVEQPVKAHDIDGLKYVTDRVLTPILADESVFSPEDAFRVLQIRAADIINIKLMKAGGIYNALKINAMAETCGVECMIGCMIENKIGIAAAAHLAGAKKNITRMDLDAPFLLAHEPVEGGISFDGPRIILSDAPGLGITAVNTLEAL